jgi:chaperone required for assembly of F1-ATPase
LKSDLIDELCKYFNTDTLLYWDPEGSELREKQELYWRSALNKFSSHLNIDIIEITDNLFELKSNNYLKSHYIKVLERFDNFQLSGSRF